MEAGAELVVQKAVELGVKRLVPFEAARSVVRLSAERGASRAGRWQRIAAEAARQCGRADVPAVDEPVLLAEAAAQRGQELVVTSYMDHPSGQAFAAWEAARLDRLYPGRVGVCGLRTDHLFEAHEFSETLGPWVPQFTPPAGTGLGFDEWLEEIPWRRLNGWNTLPS